MEIKSFDPDTQKELEDKEFEKFQSPAGGIDPLKEVSDITTDSQDKFILPEYESEMFPKKSVLPGILFFVFLCLLILALIVIAIMTKQAEDAERAIDEMNTTVSSKGDATKTSTSEINLESTPVTQDASGNVNLDAEMQLMDEALQGVGDVEEGGLSDANLGL
jgi:flagellar biosynthesis/type III secretory pathway M-ring protein FliF/YscJ